MQRYIVLTTLYLITLTATAQTQRSELPRQWGLQVRASDLNFGDVGDDEHDFYLNDDEGFSINLAADYFLSRHIALTGELYSERDGIMTEFSNGIGLKRFARFGIAAGAKWYPLAPKWILQPHVDALVQTNLCNLSSNKGERRFVSHNGYEGAEMQTNWDFQAPALSLIPRIGLDLRLVSSLSLTVDAGFRFDLWGHNRYDLRMISGPRPGQTTSVKNDPIQTMVSVGVRYDFPARPVSSAQASTLLDLLFGWLGL